MKNYDLLCPICDSKLIEGPLHNYITWADEISDPNSEMSDYKDRHTVVCSNSECICKNDHIGFWDPMGDWYWEKWVDEDNRNELKSIAKGDLTALYGSSRTIFGEKNKHSPYLNLYFYQFYLEWRLKCEPKYGKVIGIKELKIGCCKRDKDGHYYKYFSEFHVLKYYLRRFYRSKKAYKTREYNPEAWYVKELKESFSLKTYGKDGWANRFAVWFLNTFESKTLSSLTAIELLSK